MGPVLFAQLGVEFRHRGVRCFGMPDVVGDIVGERTESEGVLVDGVCAREQLLDEVAGADMVHEVREQPVAEREVAEVGDVRATVGERASTLEVVG